jgi:hypothetical protein
MNSLGFDWEIVGFNGRPLVDCGRALPIARRRVDGHHCVLDLTNGATDLHWHSQDEANEFLSEQRWTKFRSSLNVPNSCINQSQLPVTQPMVVYTNQKLLDNSDRQSLPEIRDGEHLVWKKLIGLSDDYQAACGAPTTITSLMNDWADGLLRRFDSMTRLGRDHDYLLRIADFALCAATERSKRWEAFLRYSIVQQPDKVQRTFESMIRREFVNTTWEDFMEYRRRLTDVLNTGLIVRASDSATGSSASSGVATALPKVRGIATESPVPAEQLIKS